MLSGTACGLLLLYGGLAEALAMDASSHLTPAGFGGNLAACDLACHTQNTRSCRTDGFALLSHQRPWHSYVSRGRQQHFLAAWSPQQPPTQRHAIFSFADV